MINLNEQYPNKTAGVTANYPFGQARNVTLPGDRKGTPWDQALVNDLLGFQQAAMKAANMVPSGVPDNANNSQVLSALLSIFKSGFSASLLTNGYLKIQLKTGPDFILQWFTGTIPSGQTSGVFNYPIEFPNVCLHVLATDAGFGAKSYGAVSTSKELSTIYTSVSSGGSSFRAFAVGC